MKSRFVVLFLLALTACMEKANVVCYNVDPLLKVFPENTLFMDAPDTLDAAKNTHVEFQFALHSDRQVEDFTVVCGELTGPDGAKIPAPRCGVVGYVGVGDAMEAPAHDVLKSATGMFPDPILEQDSYEFKPYTTFCPWITVFVPAGTPAGVYTADVEMKGRSGGKRFSFTKAVNVKVWPVTMQTPDFPNVNWAFDLEHCMKLWNGGVPVERYTDLHKEYLRQLYATMSEAHQNMTMIPIWNTVGMKELEDGRWEFDFTQFREYVRLCDEAGALKYLQIEELGHRLYPSWESPMSLFIPKFVDGKVERDGVDPDDPRVKAFYSCFIPALKEEVESLGWKDRCYIRLCDEPVDANAASYCHAAKIIRQFWPDMKVLEACQTTRIGGSVEAWCPQLNYWHENYDFYKKRQQMGDDVWFYTCCYPREEYPNRFIEQPLLKVRMLFWMAQKYKADGYLHWGFNYWVGDPFAETALPGTGTSLPAGDCWLIYPGYRKMLRSIRYEQHRDGIEDLTLLKMLAAKDEATADAIVNSLITNWWVYAGKPEDYRHAKRWLLESLSE